MVAFLNKEIDLAEAMIYNEYAQVLEATNPATGELYKPEDLNVFNWNDYRSSMLQDAIFVREAWLNEEGNRDIAVRFVRAALKGWIYCRDNPADCVQYTTDAGSQLGAGHQAWMMNEINALVWPSPAGVGVLDPVGLEPDGPGREAGRDHQAGSVHDGLRHLDRRRGPRGHRGRHQGRHVHQGNRRGHPWRQLSPADPNSTDGRSREGPAVVIPGRAGAPGPYTRGAGVASGSG